MSSHGGTTPTRPSGGDAVAGTDTAADPDTAAMLVGLVNLFVGSASAK